MLIFDVGCIFEFHVLEMVMYARVSVCMLVCSGERVWLCACLCARVSVWVLVCASERVWMCACLCARVWVWVLVCASERVWLCACWCARFYLCACVRIWIRRIKEKHIMRLLLTYTLRPRFKESKCWLIYMTTSWKVLFILYYYDHILF